MFRCVVFFFQAEDGIRDLVRSRGLGDVYKRQVLIDAAHNPAGARALASYLSMARVAPVTLVTSVTVSYTHLTLPTSDLV